MTLYILISAVILAVLAFKIFRKKKTSKLPEAGFNKDLPRGKGKKPHIDYVE